MDPASLNDILSSKFEFSILISYEFKISSTLPLSTPIFSENLQCLKLISFAC